MNKRRLLIADNNKDLCAVLEKSFSSMAEFDVQPSVQNGEKAFQRAVLGDIDVMLIDVVLPGLDGIEVLSRIKNVGLEDPPKVFIHSSISIEPVIRLSQSLGALYFFQKPIEFSVMAHRMLELLDYTSNTPKAAPEVFQAAAGAEPPVDPEDIIAALIRQLNIPPSIKGYHYIKSSVRLFTEHINAAGYGMTTHIYPAVAKMYDSTPSRVERAIRHAISVAWNRTGADELSKMFGCTVNKNKGSCTNSEFIAMLADKAVITLKHRA
jgi:two-component system response regulator (stage 0 sporulation protein A)